MHQKPRGIVQQAAIALLSTTSLISSGCSDAPSPSVEPGIPNTTSDPLTQDQMLKKQHFQSSADFLRWSKAQLPTPRDFDEALKAKLFPILQDIRSGEMAINPLTGADAATPEIVATTMEVSRIYHEQIPELAEEIFERQGMPSDFEGGIRDGAFSDLKALMNDASFRARLQEIYGNKEFDCKELSTVFATAYLRRLSTLDIGKEASPEDFSITLVFGLFFDDQLEPEGAGHVWIETQDQICDPSILNGEEMRIAPGNSNAYIPVVQWKMTLNTETKAIDSQFQINVNLEGQ